MKTNRFLAFIPSVLLVIFLLPQVIYAERLSIKVGAYANAPKIFQDDQGHIAGFWPDLIADIAEKENWQIEYVWGTWSEGLDRLKSGEIAMMPDVAVTESRKAQYTFSQEAVLLSWSRLYVHEDSPCFDSIFNLNNKKIAVLRDSVNYEGPGGIREFVRSFDINCTFVEYESYVDAFSAVKNNLAYGCVANRNFGDKYEKQYDLKQTTLLFQPIVVNFAFPQQSSFTPLLLPTIDKNIKSLKSETDSIYYQLLEKYFETAIVEKKLVVFPAWAKQLMVFLGLVVLVSVVAVIIYRVQLGKSRRKIRQNYAQLLEQEKKYRTLLDNQKEAVFLHKLQPEGFSCFSEVNASAVERYGYSRSEFLQISSVDISVPDEVKKHADPSDRRKLLEQGQLIFETTHIKKSGEQFPVEISTTLVELQGEKYLLSTVRDITERKKAEEFQRIKSIQQQALADLRQAALLDIDLSTLFAETTLKLAAVLNVDYANILQKLPDQDELFLIEGVGWQEGLVGRASVPADVNSQAGYTLTTEHSIIVEDLQTESRFSGSQLLLDHHVVSGLSVIIGSYKDPWGVLGVHSTRSHEFTDDDLNFVQSIANLLAEAIKRKQAEAQRQELETQLCQKYKMEAVGLIAGGIAHDFNNNLAIILGNIELSLRKIPSQSEIAPHLRNAKVAILRARDLVQQILTYSRQEVQNLQPVKLPLVIDETLKLLRATIPTTVEIETDIAHSHAMINADSTQIQEVLINLCNNAVHA
ncbi:MAG: transporter substrate-binding domain-containing protein, partial [Desulfuromonadales bacterium]|nr:transporter substrate-binding domain-containing protein [Desulfuromonadales bacterium]